MAPSKWSSFSELFMSSNFADALVKCGEDDKTWNVHRAIVCSRSKWFDKVLNGRFQEAETGVVTISETPSVKIEWLLEYLYSDGDISCFDALPPDGFDQNPLVATCEAYELGDFFDIGYLRSRAIEEVTIRLSPISYVAPLCVYEQVGSLQTYKLPDYFAGVQKAYSDALPQSDELRKPFLDVVRKSAYTVLRSEEFEAALEDVPAFQRAVVSAMCQDMRMYNEKLGVKGTIPPRCCCMTPAKASRWNAAGLGSRRGQIAASFDGINGLGETAAAPAA
ncbi:hypothetical protein BKA67DRAFT_663484 [Truncatella angustata]|uniref:BTB domain-containing protein n=1 Tax=Truncatella angustata TaxID=152316 RepID=A0A9P8RPU5_9PEZI|nr:uncharacterized protein BKA67DRAFT_663484 [Truncatella angustata]KAH6647140.1 hypothetical protein BKA67DRAFT_663484 [Truncatella angustata]